MSSFKKHVSIFISVQTAVGALIVLSVYFGSCSNSSFGNSSLDDNNSFVLSDDLYQIRYPKTWYIDTSGQMGTDFFMFSRLTNVNDNFKENINLLVQQLEDENVNLEQYVSISQKEIESKIEDGYILSNEKKQSSNGEFQKVIYTGTQGNYKLKFEQNYWVINGKAFILTFTSEVHQYKFFQKVAESIMSSFEIM